MLEYIRRVCLDDTHRQTLLCLNCRQPLTVEMVGHGALRQALEGALEKRTTFKGVFHTGNAGKCEFVIGAEVAAVETVSEREVVDGVLCVGKCSCGHADEMLLGLPYQQFRQMQAQ